MNCDRHPVRITAAQPGRRHRAGTGRSVRFLRGYVHASPTAAAADTGQDSPDEQDGAQPTTSDSGDSAPEGTDTTSGSAPEDSAAESDDAGDLIDPDPRDGIPDLDSARAQKDTSGTASGYTAVTTGGYHACGLRTDNTITCWGSTPSDPPSGQFVAISAWWHVCAVRVGGTVTCWGRNPVLRVP